MNERLKQLKGFLKGAELAAIGGLVGARRAIELGQEAHARIKFIADRRGISEDEAEAQYAEVRELSRRSMFSADQFWQFYMGPLSGGLSHEDCLANIRDRLSRIYGARLAESVVPLEANAKFP